ALAPKQETAAVEAGKAHSYDAIEPKGKRKSPAIRNGSEDSILDAGKRAKLVANSRDLYRNFSIASWMIRRHLDYVASFNFHSRTDWEIDTPNGTVDFDDYLEKKLALWQRPYNFDRAG